ncbi:MAG: PIN domain-containing protein [Opitutaceae bacterium]|nr:PIN domain-containing protein [Opitutaceae bacterium]
MRPLVFDASALLALLFGEPGAEAVEILMHRASEKDQPMLMSAVNWAEVCYRVEGKRGAEALVQAKEFATNAAVIVVAADRELSEAAATYKAAEQLGLADAFAAALAKTRKADLVTADREFKSVESEIKIIWLKHQ